ncbi:predicted protein [Cyanophage PSS2]|uniref:hypothetical protein n=1 Tax=Cyanophage PSS2 TaxID=658401 RepID=UPI0001B04052|nr:hypothetical protein PSS2_gp125 [Cyanophage PSS2]ACT65687.1 hypothetical protein [Cyanophage PSS2]ACY75823.1 predicted protein [Cyanophage PSS2]
MFVVLVRIKLEPLKIFGPFKDHLEARDFADEYGCDFKAETKVQRLEVPSGFEPGL